MTFKDWWNGRRIELIVDAIRAAGEPVTLVDLQRPSIEAERNAATFVRRARSDLESLSADLEAIYDEEANRARAASGAWDDTIYLGMWPSERVRPALLKAFAAHPSVIPLLEQAAEAPDYDPGYDYSQPPEELIKSMAETCSISRPAMRVLRASAVLHAACGRPDIGINMCAIMLRLVRHFDQEPLVIGELVQIALRGIIYPAANLILQHCLTSPSVRKVLCDELTRHDPLARYRRAMIMERAYGLTRLRHATPNRRASVHDETAYLHCMNAMLDLADSPYNDPAAAASVVAAVKAAGPPASEDLPAGSIVLGFEFRDIAWQRCLLVLLALLDQPPGATPTIDQLGLSPETTADPFGGGKLKLRKAAGGWIVYSIGANLADDGGDFTELADVGFGPPTDTLRD